MSSLGKMSVLGLIAADHYVRILFSLYIVEPEGRFEAWLRRNILLIFYELFWASCCLAMRCLIGSFFQILLGALSLDCLLALSWKREQLSGRSHPWVPADNLRVLMLSNEVFYSYQLGIQGFLSVVKLEKCLFKLLSLVLKELNP